MMEYYDYRSGKKRIDTILTTTFEVEEKDELPDDDEFACDKSYYSWITAIFVDIRDSTSLFTDDNQEKVSKIVKCFTSEILEILRYSDKLREIGTRGDRVYAIYATPLIDDIYECSSRTYYINTCIKMINKVFLANNLPILRAGIGIASDKELVVKAGLEDTDMNNKIWMGNAVTRALNLSSLGDKNGNPRIVFSDVTYDNIIDKLVDINGETAKNWFTQSYDFDNGPYYYADILDVDFDHWINNGMKD